MKLKSILTRLSKSISHAEDPPGNIGELRRAGLELAHALPQARSNELRIFRAGISRLIHQGDTYLCGYLSAMTDIIFGTETDVEKIEKEEALFQAVSNDSSKYSVLRTVAQGTRLPNEMSLHLGVDKTSVSRALKELRKGGLVRVFIPESGDKRFRPYFLTRHGRRLASQLGIPIQDDTASAPSRTEPPQMQAAAPAPAQPGGIQTRIAQPNIAFAGRYGGPATLRQTEAAQSDLLRAYG